MATAEGVFPKVGNDPLFDTEVNRFAGAGQFVAIGSSDVVSSGTAFQDIGSILITAGSLSSPFEIRGNMLLDGQQGGGVGGTPDLRIITSGNVNAIVTTGSNLVANADVNFQYTLNTGSPYNGYASLMAIPDSAGNLSVQNQATEFNQLETGSDIAILFQIRTNTNNNHLISYSFQSYRGVV